LDVLVNNAGAVYMNRGTTTDGIETTFAVNHLAYFLLTNLLLDELKRAAPSRVVNVASLSHTRGRMSWDDLGLESGYSGMRAYEQSKLANVLFTRELARRLDSSGVTVNALHPGVVRTGWGRNNGGWLGLGVKLGGFLFLSPESGARTSIYLATSPDVAKVTGRYFVKCKEKRAASAALDDEAARKLWDVSAKLTGLGA
jgi:NAD(P)-dependent dehydrogenase (short-subunit alcohol dehydrogenase family)